MVRVTPRGVRTYAVWSRLRSGRPLILTIGDVRSMSLFDARRDAADLLRGIRHGADPRRERRLAAADEQMSKLRPLTFKDLARRFLAEGRTKRGRPLKPSSLAFYERVLSVYAVPAFGKLAPETITRADVREVIEKERALGHASQANRLLAALKRVFNWAVEDKEYLATSPCVGLRSTVEVPRSRTLTNDEIRRVVAASASTSLKYIIPFTLFTAARSGEVRAARWVDFDFEERVWRQRETKSGRDQMLPLSQGALRVIAAVPVREGVEFVFPTKYFSRSKTGTRGNPKDTVREISKASGVSDWSLHDLRRTVRTRLASLGIPWPGEGPERPGSTCAYVHLFARPSC
jgi:integrase